MLRFRFGVRRSSPDSKSKLPPRDVNAMHSETRPANTTHKPEAPARKRLFLAGASGLCDSIRQLLPFLESTDVVVAEGRSRLEAFVHRQERAAVILGRATRLQRMRQRRRLACRR